VTPSGAANGQPTERRAHGEADTPSTGVSPIGPAPRPRSYPLIPCTNNFLVAIAVFDGPQDAVICTMEWTIIIVGCCNCRSRADKRYHGEGQRHENLPFADHQFPLNAKCSKAR
jgi:hypothetical protein